MHTQRCIPRVLANAFSCGDHRTRIYIGKHVVVNVGVHSCLRIIFSSFLSSFSFLRSSVSLTFSRCPSLFLPHDFLSFSCPPSTTYEKESSSLFIPHPDPLSVDTMARNDCFTPPLARELGNKLAAGLISLSRPMATPPRLRCQGTVSRGTRYSRIWGYGRKRVPAHRRQDQWLCSLAQSAMGLH